MAFPQIRSSTTSENATDQTTQPTTLPATINAGDLILVIVALDSNTSLTGWPAGWNDLSGVTGAPTTAVGIHGRYKIADGTEGGATINLTAGNAQKSCAISYAFYDCGTTPEAAGANSSGGSGPNPPNLAPSWGAADTMWLAGFGRDDGRGSAVGYPTNYTNGIFKAEGTAGGTALQIARRNLNASSEDPGAFGTVSNPFRVFTIAISPANPPVSGSFTAAAVIGATPSGSFTANAVLMAAGSASFTADALTVITGSASITADSVIFATTSGSWVADAIIKATLSGSATADAYVSAGSTSANIVADAILRRTESASFPADAIVFGTRAGSFTAEALLRIVTTGSLTADAALLLVFTGTPTANAILTKRRLGSFTANAVLRVSGGSFTANAFIPSTVTPAPVTDPVPETGVEVVITYGGVDITGYVEVSGLSFTAAVNGSVGTATVPLRDTARELSLQTGLELTIDVAGRRLWGGYALTIKRSYYFNTLTSSVGTTARRLTIEALDYNILLSKRVLHVPGGNEKVNHLTEYPADTDDDVVIKGYLADHTDLAADGVDISTYIEHVGTPSADTTIGADVGWPVKAFLSSLSSNVGSIFYLDPDRNLVYTDVDTPTVPWTLSDAPLPSVIETFANGLPAGWTAPIATAPYGYGPDSVYVSNGGTLFLNSNTITNPAPVALQVDFKTPDPIADDYWFIEMDGTAQNIVIDNWYTNLGDMGIYTYGGDASINLDPDTWYTMKAEYSTTSVRAKVWARDTIEPDTWMVDGPYTAPSPVNFLFFGLEVDGAGTLRATNARWTWAHGIRELEIDFDGANLANDALIWGAGQGSSTAVFSETTDASSVTTHGLWQVGQWMPSIWRQTTADRISDSIVNGSLQNKRGGKDDAVAVRCVMFEHGLRVADKVTVHSDVFGYDDVLPVREMRVTFPSGVPRYELVLSHAIDIPWSTFEFWFPDFEFIMPKCADGSYPPCGEFDINWPPQDPCTDQRQWSLPLDYRVKLRWHVPTDDSVAQMQLLVSKRSQLFGGGPSSYAGVLLENLSSGVADLWMFSRDGGTGATSWDGIPSANDTGIQFATDIDGVTFWVRTRVEADGETIRHRIWQDTNGEGDNWQLTQTRGSGAPFDPSDIDWLWIYFEANRDDEWFEVLDVQITEGYTGAPYADTFARELADGQGWGASEILSVGWDVYDSQANPLTALGVHNGAGTFKRELGDSPAASYMALYLPNPSLGGTDTFTRTVASPSWGQSEINDSNWGTGGASGGVDGSKGIITQGSHGSKFFWLNGDDAVAGTIPVDKGVIMTPPWDVVFRQRFPNLSSPGWVFIGDHEFSGSYVYMDYANNGGLLNLSMTAEDRFSAHMLSGSADTLSGWSAQWFWTRIHVEAHSVQIRVWLDGDTEPATWDIDESDPLFDMDAAAERVQEFQIGFDSSGSGDFWFDDLTITVTTDCTSETPPTPDPPRGEICELLTLDSAPPGHDPNDHYYRASTTFVPNSTRVWVGGLLLSRGSDYVEGEPYYGGYIQIDSSVNVTGKTVYMCYYAEPQYGVVVP